jgi:ABC-type Fe3+/spermidine/putrescine transport system ATPase subunit
MIGAMPSPVLNLSSAHAPDKEPVAPFLELRHITKRFGSAVVLQGLDLVVGEADLLGLLGPSGSGKSTMLNIIGGFILPDAGTIRMGGEDIVGLPPHRRNIGITFQSYALFPHLSVYNNVAYGLVQRRVAKSDIALRVHSILELFGLDVHANRFPRSLSGGEQQRVALARALVVRPKLMLLDEPLANLDASLRQKVRFEIRRMLRSTNVTSVFVTHDQDEAFALCDRVAILNRGKIHQVGSPAEIVNEPADAFVAGFIGSPNHFRAKVSRVTADSQVGIEVNGFSAVARCCSRPAAGTDIDVFVRPEEVRIEPLPNAAAVGGFRIADSVVLGSSREVSINGPIELRARVPLDDERFASGMPVAVSWNPQRAHAFELTEYRR